MAKSNKSDIDFYDSDSEVESKSGAKLMTKLKKKLFWRNLNKNVIFTTLLIIINDYVLLLMIICYY